MTRYDIAEIKTAAESQWVEILASLGGVDSGLLDGKHHGCPRCAGTDRFRLLNPATGAVYCNKCFDRRNGDGLAALQWLTGWDFPTTLRELAGHLGIAPASNGDFSGCPIEALANAKRVSAGSLVAYGANVGDGCVIFPAYDADGNQCTQFTVYPGAKSAKQRKGLFQKGKPAGLFFPHDSAGQVRVPQAGETWLLVEGAKDAAALHSLGYKAAGLNTCKLAQKFVKVFSGVDIIVVPDRDTAGLSGSETSVRRLYGKAASVAVAHLPAEVRDCQGADVRDIVAQVDGETLVRRTIDEAQPWSPKSTGHRHEVLVDMDEARVANEVIGHLLGSGLYQRGGRLVHVTREEPTPNARVIVPASLPRIRNLPTSILRETISATVSLVEPGGDDAKPVRPAKWLVDAIHDRGQYPSHTIPPLAGIVRCPTIRPDGTVLQEPGYDRRSGLLYDPDGDYPQIPDTPTLDDAKRAADKLLEVVCDFPFAAEEHKSVWLALPLTLIGRSAIPGPSPLFAVDANTRGSGKSLMCDVAGVIAFGDQLPRKTWPRDDEEMRKTITSVAMEGIPSVLLDNVASTLGSASLDAVLTGTTWTDRILGKSQTTGTLPLTAVWIATGNNLVLGADTARRSLYCRLETLAEHPEDRDDFEHRDLMAWVHSNRHRLAVSAVTILRAYLAAGSPDQRIKTWGSYEQWSKLIRGAIVWLGLPDPAQTKMAVRDADRTAELLGLLLDGVAEADSGDGVTAGEIAKLIQFPVRPDESDPYPLLRAAITELCGAKIDGRQVGYRLRSYAGRVCGGRRLVQRRTKSGRRWGVDSVDGADILHPSYARAHVRTHAHAREAETSTPSASSAPECNHQDPDTRDKTRTDDDREVFTI